MTLVWKNFHSTRMAHAQAAGATGGLSPTGC